MNLSREDASLFFELMWSLQFYTNHKIGLNPEVTSVEEYCDLSQEDKLTVRDRLFEQPSLIDSYVNANPDNFDPKKLSIVKSWKNFVKGEFYLERYLKNHAIFISDQGIYAVQSLYKSFDEMFHKSHLPLYHNTVLLPFKGKIIYDGLMESYRIHFGGGMKRSLKEKYMKAKQNDHIVTSLEKTRLHIVGKTTQPQGKDWSSELKQLEKIAKKLKGGLDQPVINTPVFSLIRASIELANQAITESSSPKQLDKQIDKVFKAANKVDTIITRMD
jgi:hypothetical protein